ncbi:hypothetical protein MASR1M60_16080 [Rhodocyclaceae bacterium]
MKNLTVTIRAELEVPDDWQLAEHASGMVVLKIGDQYVDFDLSPLATSVDSPEAEWSDRNADLVDTVLDSVVGVDVELEMASSH